MSKKIKEWATQALGVTEQKMVGRIKAAAARHQAAVQRVNQLQNALNAAQQVALRAAGAVDELVETTRDTLGIDLKKHFPSQAAAPAPAAPPSSGAAPPQAASAAADNGADDGDDDEAEGPADNVTPITPGPPA